MAAKARKIIAIVFLAFLVVFVAALGALWWYVRTGRLKTLVERRISRAAHVQVEMESLRVSWPLTIDIEGLSVAATGREDTPFLRCPLVRASASFESLFRRRLLSVALSSPRIHLVADDDGRVNLPELEPGGERGAPLSIGTVRIIDGEVGLDAPGAKGRLEGIGATFSSPLFSTGSEKVLRLTIDNGEFSFGRERVMPLALKRVDSRILFRSRPSANELEGDINAFLTTEIPYLLLPPDIPVTASFAVDYLAQRGALENGIFTLEIPLILPIRVFGSASNLGEEPSVSLDFSFRVPELGDLREYNEVLQRPMFRDLTVAGSLDVNGELKGSLKKPDLSVKGTMEEGSVRWRDFALQGLGLEAPAHISQQGLSVGPARLSAERGNIPVGETHMEAAPVSAVLAADASRVSLQKLEVGLENVGQLSMEGEYELGSGLFRVQTGMPGGSLESALALVSSRIYELPESYMAKGAFDFHCGVEGRFAEKLDHLEVDYSLSLENGEFFVSEFAGVAGVNARSSGNLKTTSPAERWRFEVTGEVGNFEILVDYFYKSFAGIRFPFVLNGEYEVKTRSLSDAALSLELGTMGALTARGGATLASRPEIVGRLNSDGIDIGEAYKEIAKQVLTVEYPFLKGAELRGIVSGDAAVRVGKDGWSVAGEAKLAEGQVSLAQGAFAVDSLTASMPFGLRSPQERMRPAIFREDDFGEIKLDGLHVGPVHAPSLTLETALKQNSLRIKGPTVMDVFGGEVTVGEVRGENMLNPSAKLNTSLSAEDVDLGLATDGLGVPRVSGTLNAGFPKVEVSADFIMAEGTARALVFGGSIDVASLGMERPLSPVRTLKADLEFSGIHLLEVTEVLEFGSISGVMEGTLKGLEVSQGQPAAFVADFETVKRSGVSQRINVDAVRNITILGTGQAGIGLGLAAFFDEYGYENIGFQCTLKNDNFKMRGKVMRGDTEYFVKGVLFGPSIDVINRNPGQTVSFKSMLERINRIKRSESKEKEEEEAPK